jgi:hypothetical protein
MFAFNPVVLHAHRRAQSAERWPLLRSCPSTFAVRLVRYLDSLSDLQIDALLDQWEAHDALPRVEHKSMTDAETALKQFPAIEAYNAAITEPGRSIMTVPIKTAAGSLADIGGNLDDWAKMFQIEPEGIRLDPPLVQNLEDLVPVVPATLRKVLAEAARLGFAAEAQKISSEETWYVGRIENWDVAIDVRFASNKGLSGGKQIDYNLWVKPLGGKRLFVQGYETIWKLPTQWNYLTVENAERSVKHLVQLAMLVVAFVKAQDLTGQR